MQEKMRTDVNEDSYEDLERVLEDYFRIIPSDMMFFKMENVTRWSYDDSERTIKFYFEDEWTMDEFFDKIRNSPKSMMVYMEEHDCVDRENFVISMGGKMGGLY